MSTRYIIHMLINAFTTVKSFAETDSRRGGRPPKRGWLRLVSRERRKSRQVERNTSEKRTKSSVDAGTCQDRQPTSLRKTQQFLELFLECFLFFFAGNRLGGAGSRGFALEPKARERGVELFMEESSIQTLWSVSVNVFLGMRKCVLGKLLSPTKIVNPLHVYVF